MWRPTESWGHIWASFILCSTNPALWKYTKICKISIQSSFSFGFVSEVDFAACYILEIEMGEVDEDRKLRK